MERSYFFALQRHFLGTNRVHEMAVIDAAGKQTQRQTGSAQQRVAGHHHDIHLTVLNARFRCDHRIISPLVRIGERDEERFVRHIKTVTDQVVILRRVGEDIFHYILEIRCKTTFVTAGKMVRNQRIKTRTARSDEYPSVGQTVIHQNRLRVVKHLQRFVGTHRDAEVTCKTVPATHRQNTECRLGVAQTACYLVHCAITAYCYHGIKAHARVLMCQLGRMTGVLREHNIRQPLLCVQGLHDQLRQFLFRVLCLLRTRNRINDKSYIFHKYIFMQSKSGAKVQLFFDICKRARTFS